MRILFLTFYFEPDLSAGSFRNTPLAFELASQVGPDSFVEVQTTLPNRYQELRQKAIEHELKGNLLIQRYTLPSHQSGIIDQAAAYRHFVSSVLKHTKGKQYDVVYASSSRLMTATFGAFLARRFKAKLVLDIRDLFVDTAKDVFPQSLYLVLLPLLRVMERYTFGKASHINVVSGGFTEYMRPFLKKCSFSVLTNGVDPEFEIGVTKPRRGAVKRLLYAGNIGAGQGLEKIIPGLAKALGDEWEILIIGAGGGTQALSSALSQDEVTNVIIKPPMKREELIDEYRQATCLFVHLNDYRAFEKVLPSKIFEYAATGKPILAGLKGFSASFTAEEIINAAVFTPCSVEDAIRALKSLQVHEIDRGSFIDKHNRSSITSELARHIVKQGVSKT